jgi:GT2 family glycosyltransferase
MTVIIPVFDAFSALRDCLDSIDRCSPLAPVLLIDDASPDPGVGALLRRWVIDHPSRRLIRNEANRGFVATANRGMAACEDDVVLLNSDTIVTPGWLDALHRCLGSAPDIATATPWSNNGEIVSFPLFCAKNPAPEAPGDFARAAASSKAGDYPELPTAVGFCMAISRTALSALGGFDESTFGRGYGEENDFSLRARKAGWRNVLCDDAYVVHRGGQSFGPLGLRPDQASMARLLALHPEYQRDISAWIESDPLAQRRADMQRALRV